MSDSTHGFGKKVICFSDFWFGQKRNYRMIGNFVKPISPKSLKKNKDIKLTSLA